MLCKYSLKHSWDFTFHVIDMQNKLIYTDMFVRTRVVQAKQSDIFQSVFIIRDLFVKKKL